jgi:hypothetical protein
MIVDSNEVINEDAKAAIVLETSLKIYCSSFSVYTIKNKTAAFSSYGFPFMFIILSTL